MTDRGTEAVDALKADEDFESLTFEGKLHLFTKIYNKKVDAGLGGGDLSDDVKSELKNLYVSLFLRLSFLEDEAEEYFSEYGGTPRDVVKLIDALDLIVDEFDDFDSSPKFATKRDGVVLLSYGDVGLGIYKERFVPYWLLFAEEDEIRTYFHWRAALLEASINFEKSVEISEDFLNSGNGRSLFELRNLVDGVEDEARRNFGNSEKVGKVDLAERVLDEILSDLSSRYQVRPRI